MQVIIVFIMLASGTLLLSIWTIGSQATRSQERAYVALYTIVLWALLSIALVTIDSNNTDNSLPFNKLVYLLAIASGVVSLNAQGLAEKSRSFLLVPVLNGSLLLVYIVKLHYFSIFDQQMPHYIFEPVIMVGIVTATVVPLPKLIKLKIKGEALQVEHLEDTLEKKPEQLTKERNEV